jgi:hypothetical protein
MTKSLAEVAKPSSIVGHDPIVGKDGHTSLRADLAMSAMETSGPAMIGQAALAALSIRQPIEPQTRAQHD